jgi:uncharacterized protein YecT (DUF1311 family)
MQAVKVFFGRIAGVSPSVNVKNLLPQTEPLPEPLRECSSAPKPEIKRLIDDDDWRNEIRERDRHVTETYKKVYEEFERKKSQEAALKKAQEKTAAHKLQSAWRAKIARRAESHQRALAEATGPAPETPHRITLAFDRAMSAAMSDCVPYLKQLTSQHGDRFKNLGIAAEEWIEKLRVGKFELGKLCASMLREESGKWKGDLYFASLIKFKEVFERTSPDDQLAPRPELRNPSTWDNGSENAWARYSNEVDDLIEAFELTQKGKKVRNGGKNSNESLTYFCMARSKLKDKVENYARETQLPGGIIRKEMLNALGQECLKVDLTAEVMIASDKLAKKSLVELALKIESLEEEDIATLEALIQDQKSILQFDGDHREKACTRVANATLVLLQAGRMIDEKKGHD